jgi:SAM-dependent MidA family methyltransferase
VFAATEYWIQEPSPRRRAWQEATLREFAPHVRWFDSWGTAPGAGFSGVVFANELLDAFPVRRFGWDAARQRWFEWCVGLEGTCFTWVRSDPAPVRDGVCTGGGSGLPLAAGFPADGLETLPDGFTVDLCPDAAVWWAAAARALRHGWLLTLDYGLGAGQLLAPHRTQGSLRAYRQHHLSADLLADPGEQDLTAHVDFEALRQAGEAASLQTVGLFPQARFLTRIAEAAWQPDAQFGEWTARRTRQFLTLTHPDHLGERFQVLVQSRCR